ncbi:H-type lectin domain-containing protein [Leisingera sp. ANG-M1]|uniref:H-type lectin domain-containing protein n=1 Tax=Leisingera sp. ANG-M1 TaxID=1577895 RepID=UPI00057DFCF3|nr:H-type lectin domain-containing protein [Leisingera sp. ANG-M1]
MSGFDRNAFRFAFATSLLLLLTSPVWAESSDAEGLVQILKKLERRIEELDQQIKDVRSTAITVQSGEIAIRADGTRPLTDNSRCNPGADNLRGIKNGRVDFPKHFAEQPQVVLAIHEFDIQVGAPNDTHRLAARVQSKDETGFNFQFYTWCNTVVHSGRAVWVAHGRASQ